MNYCLSSSELEHLLLSQLENKTIEDSGLSALLGNAENWEGKLLCLTLSFARILERHKNSPLTAKMIPCFYSIPDKMFMEIQECDENFIDYILSQEHPDEIDLEESLQILATRLSEYCYGKNTIRD